MVLKILNNVSNFILKNSYNRYLIYLLVSNLFIFISTLSKELAIIKTSLLASLVCSLIGILYFLKTFLDFRVINLPIQNFLLFFSFIFICALIGINYILSIIKIYHTENLDDRQDKTNLNDGTYQHQHDTTHIHTLDNKVKDVHTHENNLENKNDSIDSLNHLNNLNYNALIKRLLFICILYIVLVYSINKSKLQY